MSKLPLQLSVEKNSGVVLTGNDQERAHGVTGLGGRLITGRDFSGSRVGRKARIRRRWFGICLCGRGDSGSGHCRDRDTWSKDSGSGGGGLRYWRTLASSREEEGRCYQDDGRGGDENQRFGVRPCGLF